MGDKQRLFEFFAQEHGLSLLESEMNDIVNEVGACQDDGAKCSENEPVEMATGDISYIECDYCHRKSFGGECINAMCGMRQPGGKYCLGVLRGRMVRG